MFDEFCGKYEEAAVQYSLSDVSDLGSINVEEVENSALELNTKRTGDLNGLSIEHILFAHPIIYVHLSMLFSLIVKHGHVPLNFKRSIIIPVIKDGKKKTTDVDNYRPITIISVISKIFEMCIFRKINCLFDFGGLQLGFVKGGGCEKSLFIVSNVVNYFLKHCSDVYIMTLDATAAFDKVNVYGLLGKLLDRRVPFEIVRVLLSWYTNSQICVKLDGYCTEFITINSGVKQGGILSPLFYNVYVDDLMKELKHKNLGCTIGGLYFGTVFYADDIILLGASERKMKEMVKICCNYCCTYGIHINPTKTKWMCINVYGTSENVDFEVNGVTLENTGDSIKYLGVNLRMHKGLITLDVGDRIKKFNISAYDVLLNSADLTVVVRCELIVKKCLPILLYGAWAFKISNNDMYRLHIAYRKIFRYIFNLPLWAHISELLEVFNVKPIANLLKNREINMFKQCFASQFNELSHLASHVIKDDV